LDLVLFIIILIFNILFLGLSVDTTVNYFLSKGVNPSQLVVGCAFYSRGWGKVNNNGQDPNAPGLFGSAEAVNKDADGSPTRGAPNEAPSNLGDGGRLAGSWAYRSFSELKEKYSLTEYWDDAAQAPYMYNLATGAFFTYDNPRSLAAKANYVLEKGLGGLITWMASQDAVISGEGNVRSELTSIIKETLFGSAVLPVYSVYPAPISVHVNITATGTTSFNLDVANIGTVDETQSALAAVESSGKTVKV
jgi:chitinase